MEIIWPLIFSVYFVKSAWRETACWSTASPTRGVNPLHMYFSHVYYYHAHDGFVHGNTLLNTCIHILLDEHTVWNVFWFLMLCGGGSIHYVRGYFHCVLLLRPEEREFSPLPNKGTVNRQLLPGTEILTWPILRVVTLLLHELCRHFQLWAMLLKFDKDSTF